MSKKDFQNGFALGLASGGIIEVEDTTEIDNLEEIIDNSGVLEDTEGSVSEKVEQLIDKAKLGGKISVDSAYRFCEKNRLINYLNRFDFSECQNFEEMFNTATLLTSVPLIDTSKALNITNMFYSCTALKEVNNLNTSHISNADSLFSLCSSLTTVENLDTSKFNSFEWTFYNCSKLENVCLLDSANASSFNRAFDGCSRLKNISFVKESIKVSINFGWSSLLSAESIQSIIDGLAIVTTAQTLTLNSAITLTDEQKATIESKGWTLVF